MDRQQELRVIRRAKRGDRDAIAELISAHRPGLHRYLLRLTTRADVAEDLCQDAFVRVLRHLERFDGRFRFSTWVFTIARRLWINHLEKKRPVADTDRLDGVADFATGSGVVERDEARRLIGDLVECAMVGLQPSQLEIVDLFYRRELGVAEIADRLSMPVGTVKSHLFRGRSRMAEVVRSEAALARLAEELDLEPGGRR